MIKEEKNSIILSGGMVELDKYIDSAEILIKEDTILNAVNLHNNMDLLFVIDENCSLEFNMFDYAVNLSVNLEFELHDKSSLSLNGAFISEVKYDLSVATKLYGDNIYVDVDIRGINEQEGTVKISLEGTVAGETHGNVLNEYAKVLNKSKLSNVLIPNLIVNTNDVEANHGVSIGAIDEEEIFYLMSKGIDRESATKIIEEGFIQSNMPEDVKEKIKNILVGR